MANDDCDCGQVTQNAAAPPITNRPGLTALSYRIGARLSFLAAMKARLPTMPIAVPASAGSNGMKMIYPLTHLTTRATDDPAIALLDGWATAADVLTFYQERIANEGYLRTATERRSVLELARLVNYMLRPGVAASVYLAYTVEPRYAGPVEIAAGSRAQSVPGPGELPQTFETSDRLIARADWNTLKPRLTHPQLLESNTDTVYLQGTTTNLRPGDALLLVVPGAGDQVEHVLRFVAKVEPQLNQFDPAQSYTVVILQSTKEQKVSPVPPPVTQGGALPNLSSVIEAIKANFDPSSTGADPSSAMAKRVLPGLQNLMEQLNAGLPTDKSAALLDETLTALHAERETAGKYQWTYLAAWLDKLLAGLEPAVEAWRKASSSADQAVQPVIVPGPLQVAKVVDKLVAPPSVPPLNALRLGRDLSTAFGKGADSAVQVTAASNPQLPGLLSTALSAIPSQPLPAYQVLALRARARPHGHNAPKKQVKNAQGIVTGTVEWPLDGTQTFNVALAFQQIRAAESPQFGVVKATLSVTTQAGTFTTVLERYGGKWTNDPVPLGSDMQVQLKEPTVGAGEPYQTVVMFTDTKSNTLCSLTFVRGQSDFTIADEVGHKLVVAGSSTIAQTLDQRSFNAEYYKPMEGQERMTVQADVLLKPEPRNVLPLDAPYDQIIPLSWVAVVRPDDALVAATPTDHVPIVAQVQTVVLVSRINYDFPARVTEPKLDGDWLRDDDYLLSDIRDVTVYAQSEPLALAEQPISDPIGGDTIELDGFYTGLESGRWLIVSGERADVVDDAKTIHGIRANELVMVAAVMQSVQTVSRQLEGKTVTTDRPGDRMHTFIRLAKPLAYTYLPETVTIYGNVVKATHGETHNESLGNGDGSKALQTFPLKLPPLTYVPATTAGGVNSTLKAYVNDVEWHEATSLANLGPGTRGFLTSTDNDAKTSVIFGDGEHGARLPTGIENVKATYRSGIGAAGNVTAGQISLLGTRPLGVKDVTNPIEATGGANQETLDDARGNVPLALLALDRLVSVQDYADFARAFAGIGKADAERLSDGQRQVLHVTIAGAGDIPISRSSDLYRNLLAALRTFGDPDQAIRLDTRELLLLVISARIRLQPDYLWEPVVKAVRDRLLDTFSFKRRKLGQYTYSSEVIAAIQAVRGVAHVALEAFDGVAAQVDDRNSPEGYRPATPDEITAAVKAIDHVAPIVPALHAHATGVVVVTKPSRPSSGLEPTQPAAQKVPIRPAQLAILSPALQDTLILNQIENER